MQNFPKLHHTQVKTLWLRNPFEERRTCPWLLIHFWSQNRTGRKCSGDSNWNHLPPTSTSANLTETTKIMYNTWSTQKTCETSIDFYFLLFVDDNIFSNKENYRRFVFFFLYERYCNLTREKMNSAKQTKISLVSWLLGHVCPWGACCVRVWCAHAMFSVCWGASGATVPTRACICTHIFA